MELRVAKVLSAERIPQSEKLVKMKISLGDEERPLVAGVGKAYDPAALVGREIVVVANLEPRMLMGEESRGMLLAATDGEELPVLLAVDKEVAPGTIIR